MTNNFLPFHLPLFGEEEKAEVLDSIDSGWVTTGPKTARFEKEFAQFVGAEHALAVNSATAGLHLALDAIGLQAGDKVLTTPFTFTASAEVVRYFGADPLFVDIEAETLNIDVNRIEHALRTHPEIKAIMPVHIAGQACDMDEIMALAEKYDVKVIEDAAHSLPTTYKGRMIGTIGHLTSFSFYATKTLATGEGGMVVTQNPEYAKRIKCMRLHGISRDVFDRYSSKLPSWHYEIIAPGYKYNLTDIASALGLHQLKKVEQFRLMREWMAGEYNKAFAGLPTSVPFVKRPEDTHSWHLYILQLKLEELKINRDRFIELMSEAGIGTSVHFIPLHMQPYWRERYDLKDEDFPVASAAFRRIVSLPIYPRMTDADVQRVIKAVSTILEENRA